MSSEYEWTPWIPVYTGMKEKISDFEMPEEIRTPVRMARLIKASEMDRSFDLAFWKEVGAEGRFSAAWQMVLEVNAIRGKEHREPRLRRSVQSIQRAPG